MRGIKKTLSAATGTVFLSLLLSSIICTANPVGSVPRSPRVSIDAGSLAGTPFGADNKGGVFLGIPYAAAPTAGLRWRPPQPAPAWKGIREAQAYGPACPQLPSPWLPEMLGSKRMVTDEACLFLNVWTPDLERSAKLPVMVWIHGGGNIEGSQEWPPLGPVLAKHGVVVVTINYRLGVFGYFSHPALSAESPHHSSGNYGLLDQMAALRWVQKNIEEFGGDPRKVTVFGASSGSLDVCDLMASPLARDLFRSAVLQSGVCVDGLAPTLGQQENDGTRMAKDLGAGDGANTLQKLRAIPASELLERAARENNVDFNPTVDGWVFYEQPAITFGQGRQAKVPVIVGSNSDEVSIFASPLVDGKSYRPRTPEQYRQWLTRTFGVHAGDVFSEYPAKDDSQVATAFRNMDTDYEFGFGSRLLAHEVTDSGQKAYLYDFTYKGSGKFQELGAFHSEESILLSKKYWTSWVSNPDDEKLSNILIGYWTEFARTGVPRGPGLPSWPPYDPRSDRAQELGTHVGQIPVLRAQHFDVFYKSLQQLLHQ